MKQVGKQGRINAKANRELKKLWLAKDVRWCEYPFEHQCNFGVIPPSNAHKHNRDWYKGKVVGLLWSYDEVALLCANAHALIEHNEPLTIKVFKALRG